MIKPNFNNFIKTSYIFTGIALFFVALTIIGGFNNFSSIPFLDMWGGYLVFFQAVHEGNTSLWWSYWNEHLIILSRILFWIDLQWFKGLSIFLIIMNYILIGLSCWVFFIFIENILVKKSEKPLKNIMFCLMIIVLFSWLESDNLMSGFQSQFFLAQLLPLIAFYLLFKTYQSSTNTGVWFTLTCAAGILSVGTMANGILTLPLLTLAALLLRMNRKYILVLSLLTVLTIVFFFKGFHYAVGSDNTGLRDVLHNKASFLKYLFLYYGGPAYFMFLGIKSYGYLASFIFLTSFAMVFFKVLKTPRNFPLQLMLVTFISYIIISGFLIAIGRFKYQIIAPRYIYPMLMAWAALLILYLPTIKKIMFFNYKFMSALLLVFALTMLPSQLNAMQDDDGGFNKKVGALALALQINDPDQIYLVTHDVNGTLPIAKKASENKLSIFAQPEFYRLLSFIEQKEVISEPSCQGYIDAVKKIPDANYVSIEGWVFIPETRSVPRSIHFLDATGHIIGYGFTGKTRNDVAKAVNKKAKYSGFKGYILTKEVGKEIIINGQNQSCHITKQLDYKG